MANRTSPSDQSRAVTLFLLAGVATAPTFMEPLGDALCERFTRQGTAATAQLLFPYGDWSRSLLRQTNDIRRDMMPRLGRRAAQQVGGRRALEAIRGAQPAGGVIVIGHSGGGVAGVHAAASLARQGAAGVRAVQIGSPKCPVPPELADATLYIRAVNGRGRTADPIARIGSWGGWERGRFGVPRWNRRLYAPAAVVCVPIVGGHADYFRNGEAYANGQGVTNLQAVVDAIWRWLQANPPR